MTMTVNFDDKEGYVHAVIKGEFSITEILTVFEKTFLYLLSKQSSKVIFDIREMEGDVPWEKITDLTKKMDSIHSEYDGFSSNSVVLSILTGEEDYYNLSETIYKEADHDFSITSDYEQAEKWLLSRQIEITETI